MSQILAISNGAFIREGDGTVTLALTIQAWQDDGQIREVQINRTLTNTQWNAIKTAAAGALKDPPTR